MDVLYNHMNHMGWIIADQGWYTCWLFSNPAPKQKQSEHAMKTPHLTKKKCNKWADQAKIHVSNHVSAFPRLRSTITIPCMWVTLWSDSFSPIWQSHHSLLLSYVLFLPLWSTTSLWCVSPLCHYVKFCPPTITILRVRNNSLHTCPASGPKLQSGQPIPRQNADCI